MSYDLEKAKQFMEAMKENDERIAIQHWDLLCRYRHGRSTQYRCFTKKLRTISLEF